MLLSEQYSHISARVQKWARGVVFSCTFLSSLVLPLEQQAALSISVIAVMVRGDELQFNHSTTHDILPERVSLSVLVKYPGGAIASVLWVISQK